MIAFFRSKPGLEPSGFRSSLAPLVAGILLAIIVVLVVVHFPDLTGANQALAYGLVILVPLAGIVGALVAGQLRRQSAARFAELGAHQPE